MPNELNQGNQQSSNLPIFQSLIQNSVVIEREPS